jgi:hypothetical protein
MSKSTKANVCDALVMVMDMFALLSGQDMNLEPCGRKWEEDVTPAIVVECQQQVSLYKHVIKI